MAGYSALGVASFTVILLIAAYLIFRSAQIQTRLTQALAALLSDQLATRVEVGGVDVDFPNYLVIEQLYVEDQHTDTLAYIDRLSLGLKGYSISKRHVRLGRVGLKDVSFFLRKYQGENELNLQFIIDNLKSGDTTKNKAPTFNFEELTIDNAAFRYDDRNRARVTNAIDYTDLEVRRINLHIADISIEGDTVKGDVRRLAFQEEHGFTVNQLSGKAKVSSDMLDVKGLVINTPCTYLSLDLRFNYECWSDYKEFIDKVEMNYDLRPSVIDIGDLSFFARGLHGVTSSFRVEGKVSGRLGHMRGRKLRIGYGESTLLEGDIDMDGLPDINETFIHFKLKQLITDHRDLGTLPMPPFNSGRSLAIPENVERLGKMMFSGSFTGFLNDFVAYGRLRTALGELSSDVSLKQEGGNLRYSGNIASTAFEAGQFFAVNRLGAVSLNAKIDGSGVTRKEIDAQLNGSVSSIGFNGYDYHGITLNGRFADNRFEGQLNANDTNLVLDFKGKVDLTGKLPIFRFEADLDKAGLFALRVPGSKRDATVSGSVIADFVGDDIDNMVGRVQLADMAYTDSSKKAFRVNDLDLRISQNGDVRTIGLLSSVADADFKGRFKFKAIPKAVNNLVRKHLPSYAGDFKVLGADESIDLNFSITPKDISLVSHLFAPSLNLGPGANVLGSFYSENDEVQLSGSIPLLTVGKQRFTDIELRATNPGRLMRMEVTSRAIYLTDSATLRNVSVTAQTDNDSMALNLRWDNFKSPAYRADVALSASFPRNQQIKVHVLPSHVVIDDMKWTADPNNLITIDSTTITFSNLAFNEGPRWVKVNGQISKDPSKELAIGLEQFDVAMLNIFTSRYGLDFSGQVNGTAHVSSLYNVPLFRSQLVIGSFGLNGQALGSGHINSTWLARQEKLAINAQMAENGRKTIDIQGHFIPGAGKENFDLKVNLDGLPVSAAERYVAKVMTDLTGTIGADLTLKGPLKAPRLDGTVRLDTVGLLFTYLNVNLQVNDVVTVRPDGFYLNKVKVTDERGKTGRIDGAIRHSGFKDFNFDASITMNNLMALNTNSAHNPMYYGKAFASGVVRFFGTPKEMNLTVAAKTERGTRFNLPLNGTRSIDTQDFISFVKFKDGKAVLTDQRNVPQVKFSNLAIDLNVEVTNDAEVQILFDPKVGDILKGRGDGDLRLELTRQGEFKMFGDFTIKEGEYLFTLQNIINKKFLLRQGGTIVWSGSPYDALVDIQAAYAVRTSLSNLMDSTDANSELYKKRMLVNVLLTMKESLMAPNIQFGIELPNADDALRTQVMNKIGLSNDQELNQQVFGLLVLNNFLPPSNLGVAEGSGFLSSSSTEMISNQLSNWLSKISNDFDVGVNYRPGNSITSDELEVALSTQLFNNRLLLDGNVGVSNRQSNSSNIVGDVNVEYKITRDGRLRIRAFNKTNDQNLLTQNVPYTQGLGVSYRKDFDRIADLFKRRTKTQPAALTKKEDESVPAPADSVPQPIR